MMTNSFWLSSVYSDMLPPDEGPSTCSRPTRSPPSRPGVGAPRRCPPAQARAMRVEHEYDRGGALQYLAAWDCHRAKLFGRCEPRTGIAPFDRLVEQVM